MKFYDSPQATVSWNEDVKAVVIEWKGFALGEQYRTPLNSSMTIERSIKDSSLKCDVTDLNIINFYRSF